ncbi:MAG: hypothetical protein H6817_07175 [Phycisphaerales bacterium]|nr:hypothetical protein [Phycisphaerales bacterium]
MNWRYTRIGIFGLALLAGAGCVRRLELIEVRQDGSAKLMTRFEGDPDDVRGGDAVPSAESGWRVDTAAEKDGDRDKLVVTAERDIPAGADLPTTYAAADAANHSHVLEFPTTITVDKRPEGTYYHFRRVYRSRRWAEYDYTATAILENGNIKELKQKSPDTLNADEMQSVANAYVRAEAARTLTFVDAALATVQDDVPQDFRLDIREAASAVYDDADLRAKVVTLLTDKDSDKSGDSIMAGLQERVLAAIANAGEQHHVSAKDMSRIRAAYESARTDHAISEDIGDDVWTVAVRLPGRIIAHNSEKEDEKPKSADEATTPPTEFTLDAMNDGFLRDVDRCGWSFEGKALYDRDVVLMATSFVPKEK